MYHIDNVNLAGLWFVSGTPPVLSSGSRSGYDTEGGGEHFVEYVIYLIRCKATLGEKEKLVEQFIKYGF